MRTRWQHDASLRTAEIQQKTVLRPDYSAISPSHARLENGHLSSETCQFLTWQQLMCQAG